MRKIIIASHGELSVGILNSVKLIVGEIPEEVETYSLYPGQSSLDYSYKLEKEVEDNNKKEFIIITDIKGGSVYNALYQLIKYKNVKLFSGMNMNLLLEIFLSGENVIDEDKSDELIDNARNGITYTCINTMEEVEEEEF